jgi:3-oxoacyl-[acyl-carrier protein] reductase
MIRRTIEAVPLKRAGQPDEIASLVAFLANDGCGYINGAVLDANGGVH